MNKKILWIEDDYYAIKGLLRPLELDGFVIEVATSALEGYTKSQNWREYDLMVVDLILPLSDDNQDIPQVVRGWDNEEYTGIGLAKWLKQEMKVQCPILMMSVVSSTSKYNLQEYGLNNILSKKNLLPSRVKSEVYKILEGN